MASMSMVFKHVYRNANQVESIGKAGGGHRHNCHLLKFSNQNQPGRIVLSGENTTWIPTPYIKKKKNSFFFLIYIIGLCRDNDLKLICGY